MCVRYSLCVNLFQIVLLVTKAVGDFLGTNGIADETIRFNGFPFLEKEDHAYNVTGKAYFPRISRRLTFPSFCCYDERTDDVAGDGYKR